MNDDEGTDRSQLLEIHLQRTLKLAVLAAEAKDFQQSQHHGMQCRDILLSIYGDQNNIKRVDFDLEPPLKNTRIRKFYKKKLKKDAKPKPVDTLDIDLYTIQELFCPNCMVFLMAGFTLDINFALPDESQQQDLQSSNDHTAEQANIHKIPEFPQEFVFKCKACGFILPKYQLRPPVEGEAIVEK